MKQFGWTIVGLIMSGVFWIFGMIFLIFKEKACTLISGYNCKTKKEREEYDEIHLSKDECKFFFICAIIYLVGAVISIFVGALSFWIAFIVWLVYFFKNLHLDDEKAFDKYKK